MQKIGQMTVRPENRFTMEVIKEKLAVLYADRTLQCVLLFGSLTSGRRHEQSDIDLGFLFDGPVDILDVTNRVNRLLGSDNVDVVNLRRASPLLKFAASRKGIILYERDPGLFSQFRSLAYRMYVDTRKLRDARNRVIEEFVQTRKMA